MVKPMAELNYYQERILQIIPEEQREKARAAFERHDAMTPEERDAERKASDEAYARKISEGLQLWRRDQCGLNGKQWLNTFGAYRPKTHEQAEALKAARAFVKEWPEVSKGLMLYGPPGRGKDHLLHAITIALFERKELRLDARYWYSLDIERDMINEWNRDPATKSSDDTKTEELMRGCDLLLIGDLHKILHVKSPQIVNAMRRTINQCESTGKPILCCTGNFGLAEYDKLVDEFMGSRLAACCEWYHVDGADARRGKP
jgi:DNA replication protein DnaC